jgi:hypothetical protein
MSYLGAHGTLHQILVTRCLLKVHQAKLVDVNSTSA